jgi:hypothetical protein
MRALAAVLLIGLLVSGCWRWVPEEVAIARRCLGGTVNTEKRITDVTVAGRTRNTTIRTDACLD